VKLPRLKSYPEAELGAETKPTAARQFPRAAGDNETVLPSPARTLQQLLDTNLQAPAAKDDGRRWPVRSTLLLSGGVSVGLWIAIVAAVAAAVH
jgi:hypothetical protein